MTMPTTLAATAAALALTAALSAGPVFAQTGPIASSHPTARAATVMDDGDGYYAYAPSGRWQDRNCRRTLVVINGHHSEWRYVCD